MLDKDSPLKRVPARIAPKQALFVDGIRHSFEIIEFAYARLRSNLTLLAMHPPSSSDLQVLGAQTFLDAWAMVDSIDRFRMLYQQMPGVQMRDRSPDIKPLSDCVADIRNLRNVADHLSQRAEYVVARDAAALGTLTWFTGFSKKPAKIWCCALRPGTLRVDPVIEMRPVPNTLEWPTDGIRLKAAGYEADLSGVREHIELRVRHFESQLDSEFKRLGLTSAAVANDFFNREACRSLPIDFSWRE